METQTIIRTTGSDSSQKEGCMNTLMHKMNSLLDDSIEEQNPERMQMVRHLFMHMFKQLAMEDMEKASDIADRFDGTMHYNNYVTQEEAESTADCFDNQDGTSGPHFRDGQELFDALEDMEIPVEHTPCYNKWSLWLVANMYSSDHDADIRELVGDDEDKYLRACCKFAASQLSDKDKPHWVRWYFSLD